MKSLFKLALLGIILLSCNLSAASAVNSNTTLNNNDIMEIQLKDGLVQIELYPNKAPLHVARIKELVMEKFYDGLTFHRVISGFMAQTGDPTGTGMSGSNKPNLKAEFNDIPFERGVLGMARSSDPNSANSQFFIMFSSAPHLNGQYTALGKVIKGMEFVDNIKKGDSSSGTVQNPDKMISVVMLSNSEK